MPDLAHAAGWLPLAFYGVMALALLAYVLLDGYDLGIGILLGAADAALRDDMVVTIAPFWDANETWLVLGIGILLTAFPLAHGVILGALYLPVAAMLVGLILRGVAFDFRIKAHDRHQAGWNRAFCAGSLLAALAQGYMLGLWLTGFSRQPAHVLFALAIGLALPAGYALLGAGWLILKGSPAVLRPALAWARLALWLTALGIAAVSLATPLILPSVAQRWFAMPQFLLLAPIPLVTLGCVLALDTSLRRLPARLAAGPTRLRLLPFLLAAALFVLAFNGLAYSLFPWLVPDRLTLWQAAADVSALRVIFAGVAVVLPLIIAYTVFSYRVFRGPAAGWFEGGGP